MEGIVSEYDRKDTVCTSTLTANLTLTFLFQIRGPSGSSVTGIVPTNAYPCLPSPDTPTTPRYVVVAANGDSMYKRAMEVIGRPDLTGLEYQQNHNRVAKQAEIEEAIRRWTEKRSAEEVIQKMRQANVAVGQVANVKDIMENEQIQSRGAIQEVQVQAADGQSWPLKMQGTFPTLGGVDPKPKWAGPNLGAHTDEVLRDKLGLGDDTISKLRADGIVG